jgi:Spy/CpxP family protein refolding chaperone
MSDLKLTQEQTAKLQKISDMFLAETQSHRSVLQSKLTELATLWTAESPNEALIRAKVAEVDSVRAKIRNAMIDRTFSVMNVLTADQKAKMRSAVSSQQSTAVDFGYGLGFGCAMNGGGCYMMGVPAGQGGGRRRL